MSEIELIDTNKVKIVPKYGANYMNEHLCSIGKTNFDDNEIMSNLQTINFYGNYTEC